MPIKYPGNNALNRVFQLLKSTLDSITSDLESSISTVGNRLDVVGMMAHESDFKSEANFRAIKHGFDYICIEPFTDTEDIDTTVDDGATVVSSYFNASSHIIDKTSTDTLTIQSTTFSVETTPYKALILADYDGTGSVTLYFSKNNGTDWILMNNDELTDLNALVQKQIKIKIVMSGKVRLKNIAWGCK